MYYICKFSNTWSLYDGKTGGSRLLDPVEIDCLKKLFGSLLDDPSKILLALQINAIPPGKLIHLSPPAGSLSTKK